VKLLVAALSFAMLAACGASRCPNLAPELSYCLRAPGSGPHGAFLQEVAVKSGERFETLLLQTENDGARLAVVGISPLGQTLVSAVWDGKTVRAQPAMPSLAPDPAAMLAFAQFGLWTFDVLRGGFPAELRGPSELRTNGATLRLQDRNGHALLEIQRDGVPPSFARTLVRLPTIGMEIRSRTLEERPSRPDSP
jgi:hypothetical protein